MPVSEQHLLTFDHCKTLVQDCVLLYIEEAIERKVCVEKQILSEFSVTLSRISALGG